jgi:hypothetical protein
VIQASPDAHLSPQSLKYTTVRLCV